MPPFGSSTNAKGRMTRAPAVKAQGSKSNIGDFAGKRRVTMMAMLHSNAARISMAWPIT